MKTPAPFSLTTTPLTRGVSLIEASAGTGKTYAITALFVRLMVEENLAVREILTVTYTEAATEELRHRVRQALVLAAQAFATGNSEVPYLQALVDRFKTQAGEMEARLQNALRDFDEAQIFTIHGFASGHCATAPSRAACSSTPSWSPTRPNSYRKSPTTSGANIFMSPARPR